MLCDIHPQKKWLVVFLVLLLCTISVIGCSNKETPESEEPTQTDITEKTETEDSKAGASGAKYIKEGRLYKAVDEAADLDTIREMIVERKIVLYIDIEEDSPETFIEAAEKIAKLDEIRVYPSINLSTNNIDKGKETAMLTINWNSKQARYESTCWDLTTDKRVEEVYKQNEFFSKIDMMNIYHNDLNDLKDDYLNQD